jgi:hypothetical protein
VELVTNGDFAAADAGWTLENRAGPLCASSPPTPCDGAVTFDAASGALVASTSGGPSARVATQRLTVPASVSAATFSVHVTQSPGSALDPQNVSVIEQDPIDVSGDGLNQNALRLDLLDAASDPFTGAILVSLVAPTDAVDAVLTSSDPALLSVLQAHAGGAVRLRIGMVESTFPFPMTIDDVSLVVTP